MADVIEHSASVPEPKPPRSARRVAGLLIMAALFAVGKLKWVVGLLKFAKLGTLVSMMVSIGAYAMYFGWPYAVGFVLLIFVHEMGHAVAMRRMGIPAGAPVFIPFMGAVIAMKGRPRDAWVEAIVGIGGPALGTAGAAVVLAAAFVTGSGLLFALASIGFLINLFNMLPISPLDGGRIAGAMSRWFWAVGYAIGIPLFITTGSPILMIILLLGAFTVYRMWKSPPDGYYDIPGRKRVTVAAGYFGLLAVMVLGMWGADAGLARVLPHIVASGAVVEPFDAAAAGLVLHSLHRFVARAWRGTPMRRGVR